jgi:hypothetical protein
MTKRKKKVVEVDTLPPQEVPQIQTEPQVVQAAEDPQVQSTQETI